MKKRSKRYQQLAKDHDCETVVSIADAVKTLKGWASLKFDQSVEVAMHLGIDARQADQIVRGAISLPHGIGKTLKVIAFCEGDEVEKALAAGATEVGGAELVEKVQKGWMDFDVAVAHPRMMGQVGKLGRVLGPQGKMPSPKNGTVTPKVEAAVKDYVAGKVDFKNDALGNVQASVGKISFEDNKLQENIVDFIKTIKKLQPTSIKGQYIKKVALSATMSPSIIVDVDL